MLKKQQNRNKKTHKFNNTKQINTKNQQFNKSNFKVPKTNKTHTILKYQKQIDVFSSKFQNSKRTITNQKLKI